ncbi:MAG: efflux RND transporter periplasmic adaptor subunit, partial [Bdellovibrionales bacterium]
LGKVFEGEITAINSKIDEATRNVQVRATFKNPERLLLPGMFVKVSIESGAPVKYITLPQTSITYNPYGNTVFLVEEKQGEAKESEKKDGGPQLTAKQTFVTTGETRGDQIAILKGVKEGDTVVTSGQIKLRNGSAIVINNEITPANDPNPKPQDR